MKRSINIFVERLREFLFSALSWIERIVKDHEKFTRLIEEFGLRDPELKQVAEKSVEQILPKRI